MKKKNLLLLAIFTATATNAFAQSDFLGLSGSGYIDNIADSEATQLGLLPEPHGETSENRFWTRRAVSAAYSFSHQTENLKFSHFSADFHSFVPEFYLESSNGLSLNIGGLYEHFRNDEQFPFGLDREGDTYAISLQPAYDTLSLWKPDNRPQFMGHSKLIAGLGLVYEYQNYDAYWIFASPFKIQSHTFRIYPNLVFVQPISEKFITFLIPAYNMRWTRTKMTRMGFSQTSDSHYGLFTLTARGDYKIAERFFISAFASWKRDIDGVPEDAQLDTGEFGGQLRFAISRRLALRVGYSYESVRHLETHNCFARLQAAF